MSAITVHVGGDHPVSFTGHQLDGYHRPLSGESANLTVSVGPGVLFAGWLECPPLGAACAVSYDGETVLDGYLTGVTASAEGVRFGVEG